MKLPGSKPKAVPAPKKTVYNMDDLAYLVKEELWDEAEETVRLAGIDVKYGEDNRGRQRQKMTEIRNKAYSLQRDMRAVGYDTQYIRSIIKGLSTGGQY